MKCQCLAWRSVESSRSMSHYYGWGIWTQWCKLPKRLVSIRAFLDDLGLSEEMRILFYRPALPCPSRIASLALLCHKGRHPVSPETLSFLVPLQPLTRSFLLAEAAEFAVRTLDGTPLWVGTLCGCDPRS